MVRIDKTLSELHDLKNNPSDFTVDQLKEVATMAINALHKQEIEHENFVDASFKAIKKQEEEIKQYKKCYNELAIEIEKAFDNWALGNFDDERYHIEIQLIVHNLKR